MNTNYAQLEELLLHKEFEELSLQQQSWVQNFMSSQEYQAQRRIILESKAIFSENPIVPKGDLASLQAQFKAKHQKSFGFYLNQPIAAYQTFLFAAIVGCLAWWLRPIQTHVETQIQKQTVYVTTLDTIFQEKIIYKEKVIYKTKTIRTPPLMDTVYMPFANKEIFYQEDKTIPEREVLVGKSMKELRGLMDFVANTN